MAFTIFVDHSQKYPVVFLKDNTTNCEAEIYTFGGLLNAFKIAVSGGETQNMIDGFADVADAEQNIVNGFKSTKLSPFVCRLNKGTYHFNDHTYRITKHFLQAHAIHGLLYDAVYAITAQAAGDEFAAVTFSHEYKGTDSGYPFSYHIMINWKLETGNRLSVQTTIEHTNKTAIPMADGWHPYFTLGGLVDDWDLQFSASSLLEYDQDLLPTGEKIPDTRFVDGVSLKGITLDNGFEFCQTAKNRCILSNKQFRLTIEPDKNYPVLQVYTPPHRKSIALENLSGAPDNFNNGMGLVLLPPGEKKVFGTSYVVALNREA